MPFKDLRLYRFRGARALVILHERELRLFLPVWRRAREAGVRLPATDDPNYASLSALLHHVLRAGRGYLTWMSEKLGLPDPGVDPAPPPGRVEKQAEGYLEHLLERWRAPLRDVEPARFEEQYTTRWGATLSIDSMLEHAVMHPIRHRFQLEELLEAAATPERSRRGREKSSV